MSGTTHRKEKSAKSNRSTNIKESEEPTSPSRSPRSNMEEVKETEVSDENMDITDAISVTERSTEVTSEAVREIPASAEGTDNTIGLENASAASISENQSANGETAPGMFDLSFISNPSAIDSTDPADGPSAPNTSIDSASVVMEVSSFSTNDTSGQVVSSTNLDSTEANDTDGGTASVPTTTVPAPATETIERCPPNVDPEIWRELPEDVRSEILATEGDSGDMIENTELDREVLDALPVDVRNEVLLQEQSQRRIRGASITNAPTDHEANASGSGAGDNGAALSTSDGVQAPVLTVPRAPVMHENAIFLASLTDDIRRDVLLSADEAFLVTLSEEDQAEARRLRERHHVHFPAGMESFQPTAPRAHSRAPPSRIASSAPRSSSSSPSAANSQNTASPSIYSTKISKHEDRVETMPYSGRLIYRLLLFLTTTKSHKCPRPLLRLLAVTCRYKQGRLPILMTIFGIALQQKCDVNCLELIPDSITSADKTIILSHVMEGLPSISIRRMLNCLSYLIRKTDNLIWIDIMSRNICVQEGDAPVWLFENLLKSFKFTSSSADFDYALQLLECLCNPLSKLTITQANELVMKANMDRNKTPIGPTAVAPTSSGSSDSSSIKGEPGKEQQAPARKRRNTRKDSNSTSITATAASDQNSSSTPVAEVTQSPAEESKATNEETSDEKYPTHNSAGVPVTRNFDDAHTNTYRHYCGRRVGQKGYHSPCGHCDGVCGPNGCQCKSCYALDPEPSEDSNPLLINLPFPALTREMMESLASMAGLDLCGGTMRKQILRILTTLSLYDGNWTGLLLELSKVGTRLSLDATDELSGTHKLLKGVSEVKGCNLCNVLA